MQSIGNPFGNTLNAARDIKEGASWQPLLLRGANSPFFADTRRKC